MAHKQIGARTKGDDYQARFFWYMASQLLIDHSNVSKVVIEYQVATHVDDVAVFYNQSREKCQGGGVDAEFYQVKYHVDHRNAYAKDALIDPSFINSPKESLLQHFFVAYNDLYTSYSSFTLNLVSNWDWLGDDDLAKSIRDGGTLPDSFFSSTPSAKSREIREKWKDHLSTNDDTFLDFCQKLRLKLNYFGNADLNTALSDRLYRAGLIPLDPKIIHSPYDDLARKLVQTGRLEFDKKSLYDLCQNEGLIQNEPLPGKLRSIGIRSYMRFAENMGIDADAYVCVANHFDGRYPKTETSWSLAASSVEKLLKSQETNLCQQEHGVLLDCHSSLAFLAGYLISFRPPVYPVGPRPSQLLIKPKREQNIPEDKLWNYQVESLNDDQTNLAVAVSVANLINKQVREYILGSKKEVGKILYLEPVNGTGTTSILNADHAWAMAVALVQIVRRQQSDTQNSLMFISAPNFLTFFIGQLSHSLGKLTLFEFGMDDPNDMSYQESITIPLLKSQI